MYPESPQRNCRRSFLQAPASPKWHSPCWQCPWLHTCPDAWAGGGQPWGTSAPGRRPESEGTPGHLRQVLRLPEGGAGRPLQSWGSENSSPLSFPGTFHPVSHRGFAEEAQRRLWAHVQADLSSLASPFPWPSFCICSPPFSLIRIQGRRVPRR